MAMENGLSIQPHFSLDVTSNRVSFPSVAKPLVSHESIVYDLNSLPSNSIKLEL